MRNRKSSLIRRMTLWFFLVILLPMTLLSVFLYVVNVEHNYEKQIEDNYALLNVAGEAIAGDAAVVENAVYALSYHEKLLELLTKDRQTPYERVIHQKELVEDTMGQTKTMLSSMGVRLVLAVQDSRVPTSWWYVISVKDIEETADYQRFMSSGESAGWVGPAMIYPLQMVYNKLDNSEMLCYYHKVLTGLGECVGVIKCGVEPGKIFATLKTLGQDKLIHVQYDGQIVYGDGGAAQIAMQIDPTQNVQTIDGQLCLVKRVDSIGVQLVMRLDRGLLLRQAFSNGFPLLLAVVGSGIFLLIATHVFLRSIRRRIGEAVSFAAQVRSGKMDVRFPNPGHDEMGELIEAFNSLLSQFQDMAKARIEHERAEKRALRLALQYQMNPHFLFNTLNWIHMSIELDSDKDAISKAIVSLGRLLRYNLKDAAMASLTEELENTREYIRLMNMRKDDLIFLETDVEGLPQDEMVMRFLFQPLCENAIQHGMIPGKPLHIRITGCHQSDGIYFTVENDGTMIPPERLDMLQANMEHGEGENGVGVVNIAARLRLLYGTNSSITVTSQAGNTCISVFMEDKKTK